MKIRAIDRDGAEHVLEGIDGWTMMEILRDAGLPIEGECGGGCACATCHIYVEHDWFKKLPAPAPAESELLEFAHAVEANSRLACQIVCQPDIDNIAITLAKKAASG